MNNIVPIEFYESVYYIFILIIIFITLIHSFINQGTRDQIVFNKYTSIFLLLFVILYIGLRPIHGSFIDMTTYALIFEKYAEGYELLPHDKGFQYFVKYSSAIMTVEAFFLLCCALYVFPLYYACKRWFNHYYFFGFLICIASFSFWAYGTNGIRNGIATSIVLLGMSMKEKKKIMLLLFILALTFHNSVFLPVIAFLITLFYKNTKFYFLLWFMAIPLSLILGNFWVSLFANLGFGDERAVEYLLTSPDPSGFSSTGFRWDFLLYSMSGIIPGMYFYFKNKILDKTYLQLLNTYLLCNAFWILVIEANFSNRFAYLSWFMLGIVLIYPFLKFHVLRYQYQKLGFISIIYFSFTYIMFLLK